MKTLACVLVFLSAVSAVRAQGADLTGTWSMTGYSYVENDVTLDEMTEEMMGDTLVSDFFFLEDGKFKQTTNMSGSGTLDIYEGTWKTSRTSPSGTLKTVIHTRKNYRGMAALIMVKKFPSIKRV